jgi:hypothetical protein
MILNQKVGRLLTEPRTLKYEAILLEKDDLILTSDDCLNLVGRQPLSLIKYCCLDLIEYQSKVRSDLQETLFKTSNKFFVDSSSQVIEGKRHNG